MSCAKTRVVCTIVNNGQRFIGTNDCANPQKVCPRISGEGYGKCRSTCQQEGHAEIMALKYAGGVARGGIAFISGHRKCCPECEQALKDAGVGTVIFTNGLGWFYGWSND